MMPSKAITVQCKLSFSTSFICLRKKTNSRAIPVCFHFWGIEYGCFVKKHSCICEVSVMHCVSLLMHFICTLDKGLLVHWLLFVFQHRKLFLNPTSEQKQNWSLNWANEIKVKQNKSQRPTRSPGCKTFILTPCHTSYGFAGYGALKICAISVKPAASEKWQYLSQRAPVIGNLLLSFSFFFCFLFSFSSVWKQWVLSVLLQTRLN